MKTLLFTLFLAVTYLCSAQPNIKTWNILKTLIDVDTVIAEKIIKASGYKYRKSFSSKNLRFSEFSRGYTRIKSLSFQNWVPDDIFIGSKDGKVAFIKIEVLDESYADYAAALQRDGFIIDDLSETDKTSVGKEMWTNSKGMQVIGYRQRGVDLNNDNSFFEEYRLDALFVVKDHAFSCFPSPKDFYDFYTGLIYKKSDVTDGYETFHFEKWLKRFSCVSENSTDDQISNDINAFWNMHYSRMNAEESGFNLGGRNILFYGVKTSFHSLLYTLFSEYKLDPSLLYWWGDNEYITLVDFALRELERRKKEVPITKHRIKDILDSIDFIQGRYPK